MADSQALRDLIELRERQIAGGYDAETDDHVGPAYLCGVAAEFQVGPTSRLDLLHACALLIAAVECMDRAAQPAETSSNG